MPSTAQIIAAARKYAGVPFHHQGRDRNGLDCIGLIVATLRDVGIHLNDRTNYVRFPTNEDNGLELALEENFLRAPTAFFPGTIASFRFEDRLYPTHVAWIIGGDRMIHAHALARTDAGFVVETGMGKLWKSRLWRCYHVPGVNYFDTSESIPSCC